MQQLQQWLWELNRKTDAEINDEIKKREQEIYMLKIQVLSLQMFLKIKTQNKEIAELKNLIHHAESF